MFCSCDLCGWRRPQNGFQNGHHNSKRKKANESNNFTQTHKEEGFRRAVRTTLLSSAGAKTNDLEPDYGTPNLTTPKRYYCSS